MTETTYLIKPGELTLKGGNRQEFERRLVKNARILLSGTGTVITAKHGRFFARTDAQNEERAEWALDRLVGISGWAKTRVAEKSMDSILSNAVGEARAAQKRGCKTFKIETRRADKRFPLTSFEISRDAGSAVIDALGMIVDVRSPDAIISIEVRENACFIYSNANPGARGLPAGASGKALALLSGGIDSPVAAYKMICRGMKVDCLYFHAWPYTSDEAKQKVVDLARTIAPYGIGVYLNVASFTDVQKRIKDSAPEQFSTLLLRMCMMKTADRLAKRIGAKCIVTGESLGQVASQTIENIAVVNECANTPILRPLIGTDKEDIIDSAKRIGTYEISILPYEDCCTLFAPKHPILRSDIKTANDIFSRMDVDSLLDEAYEKREIVKIPAAEF